MSVLLYLVLALIVPGAEPESAQGRVVTFALTAAGVFLAIISFAIKQKFIAQAEAQQSPGLFQTGLIISLALCEAAALLGLLDHFVTGNPYYFVLFIVAILGMLLHFPRRDQLAVASYRLPTEAKEN
jgi:putative exporter of polyketide antibiotics